MTELIWRLEVVCDGINDRYGVNFGNCRENIMKVDEGGGSLRGSVTGSEQVLVHGYHGLMHECTGSFSLLIRLNLYIGLHLTYLTRIRDYISIFFFIQNSFQI